MCELFIKSILACPTVLSSLNKIPDNAIANGYSLAGNTIRFGTLGKTSCGKV